MNEFRAPTTESGSNDDRKTVFKPLDQTLITAVMIILIALFSWMAYTIQHLSVSFAEFSVRYEASEDKRDLNLLYMDRRLENLENGMKDIQGKKVKN